MAKRNLRPAFQNTSSDEIEESEIQVLFVAHHLIKERKCISAQFNGWKARASQHLLYQYPYALSAMAICF